MSCMKKKWVLCSKRGKIPKYFRCLDLHKLYPDEQKGMDFPHPTVRWTYDPTKAMEFKTENDAFTYAWGHLFGQDYRDYRATRLNA